MKENIISFKDADKSYIKAIGGKGANLCELTKGNFPVPTGFCITTDVYFKISQKADISGLIDQLPETVNKSEDNIKTISASIRNKLKEVEIPEDIFEQLILSYQQLEAISVAVRSSSTAEDLKEASFAGQQDTFLNIKDQKQLLEAVKNCFASLWNERAIIYRIHNNIDNREVGISVVVQKLINSSKSGVLFTANPITGCRVESLIDAGPGLGEAIVSGITTPDQYIIDMNNDLIIKKYIGKERTVISSINDGGTESKININETNKPVLSDHEIMMVAELGRKIQNYYSSPQDIEWAIDEEGILWVLQSRPITTLFPLPKDVPDSRKEIRVYLSATADEGVTRPISPMGIQIYNMLVNSIGEYLWGIKAQNKFSNSKASIEIGERFYYDITPVLTNKIGRKIFEGTMSSFVEYTSQVWAGIKSDERLKVKRTPFTKILWIIFSPLFRTRFIPAIIKALINPDETRVKNIEMFESSARFSLKCNVPYEDRVELIGNFIFSSFKKLFDTGFSEAIAGYIGLGVAKKLLGKLALESDFQKVLRGTPNNPTTEMNLEIWNMAVEIKKDIPSVALLNNSSIENIKEVYHKKMLPTIFQKLMDDFIEKYGVRTISEIDIGIPRWKEEPTYIFRVLKNYIKLKDSSKNPDEFFRKSKDEGERTVLQLKSRARGKSKVRGNVVSWGLDRARKMTGRRELWKVQLTSIFSTVREELLKIGEYLVSKEVLTKSHDIFSLNFSEISEAINGKNMIPLIIKRHELYEIELKRARVPLLMLSDGTIPAPKVKASTINSESTIIGIAASPGKIKGKARIILDPEIAIVEPGEIIVAPSTDPCWTPLFLTAAGLVMEKGGAMSHGAVVAREYGIPAVVGAIGAIGKIVDGQSITVDGDNGVVSINS